ncbi:D-isomer specific 2-hydroxyacid dehydrogenase [Pigmentiphaga litoralis]|jgi:D-3-phosphoglycerate dehydrogenase|uniref:D-2-hydroxyacid dehydrogenase family protein n=1 Tax=Pigmentiphaga litoralis TaxID=516702 RepID=UPI00167857EC|nr:D-2-hydroxyacid dehydrogenase family protein [Pigmentiphaga litoralis]GGX24396.1 D-isomer specific 2-hydroxyacid dehydrogenase [Pigmentiphaga litoralis]
MRITILDDYQDAARKLHCISLLDGHEVKVYNNTVKGLGQLAVRLRDTEALVLIRERTSISRALIEKLPQLKLIAQTGRAGSHVDIEACTARGIAVAQGVGSPVAPAELTWALIMTAMRRIPQYVANLKHGAWQQSGMKASSMPPNFGLGSVLHGKTLGIYGYGRIGKLVAGYGKAFGMNVVVWGRESTLERAKADGWDVAPDKATFFQSCDVISLLLKLTEDTRGIVSKADLNLMKPTALIVNTSRAELIESDALVLALNRGRPGLAAIDVFESEPILQGHPLLRMENVICTPHIGFVETDSYEMYFRVAFENIVAWVQGQPKNIVNPEVLSTR